MNLLMHIWDGLAIIGMVGVLFELKKIRAKHTSYIVKRLDDD